MVKTSDEIKRGNQRFPPKKHRENYARSTFPDLKQEVQTYILLEAPFTFTLTDLMLDFHILFDRLCEWLTLIPK